MLISHVGIVKSQSERVFIYDLLLPVILKVTLNIKNGQFTGVLDNDSYFRIHNYLFTDQNAFLNIQNNGKCILHTTG